MANRTGAHSAEWHGTVSTRSWAITLIPIVSISELKMRKRKQELHAAARQPGVLGLLGAQKVAWIVKMSHWLFRKCFGLQCMAKSQS